LQARLRFVVSPKNIVVSYGSEEKQELSPFLDGVDTLSGEGMGMGTHIHINPLARAYNADAWFSNRVLGMKHIVANLIRGKLSSYLGCISNLQGKALTNVTHSPLSNNIIVIRESENRTLVKLEPSTLVNDKVAMHVPELEIGDQGIDNGCTSAESGYGVEPFCAPYLRSPVTLFFAIMIFIVGQRLDSYGLDSAGVVTAVIGWLLMAISAAMLIVFIAPFFAHWAT